MDRGKAAATICACFSMADQLVSLVGTVEQFQVAKPLKVVGSDFH